MPWNSTYTPSMHLKFSAYTFVNPHLSPHSTHTHIFCRPSCSTNDYFSLITLVLALHLHAILAVNIILMSTSMIGRQQTIFTTTRGGEIAQLVRVHGWWPWGQEVRILVPAITFTCVAIHFPDVDKLQLHQKPVPLIPCLYSVIG